MLELGRRVAAASSGEVFLVSAQRGSDDDPAPRERRAALERALAETGRGLPAERCLEIEAWAEPALAAERLAPVAAAASGAGTRPAVVCEDECVAAQALAALGTLGLAVGRAFDLAYLGPADLPPALAGCPALAATFDYRELGRAGSGLLRRRIAAGPGRSERVMVPAAVRECRPGGGGET